MYKDQQGQQPEGDPGDASANPDSKDGEKKDDDVIYADFEEVDGYNLNQGTYALILLQEAEKLNKARTILEKKDYYKNWEPEYKQEVLSRS